MNEKFAHTPGPWTESRFGEVIDADGQPVVLSSGFSIGAVTNHPERAFNKVLAMAAPELLEALILMIRTHDEPAESLLQEAKEQQWLAKARAAIDKATGKTSEAA